VIRGFGVRIAWCSTISGPAMPRFGFLRRFRFEKLKLDRSLGGPCRCQDAGSRAMMLSSSTALARAQ
jgi:hypothetical protein